GRAAPGRRLLAIAPPTRAIERVHADAGELVHGADPPGPHPVGMVVGGFADLGKPDLAVECRLGDPLRTLPCFRLGDDVLDTIAGKAELAGMMPVRILIDDCAHV